jgi:uncharacterized ion transporter superfamily protein YfcC
MGKFLVIFIVLFIAAMLVWRIKVNDYKKQKKNENEKF